MSKAQDEIDRLGDELAEGHTRLQAAMGLPQFKIRLSTWTEHTRYVGVGVNLPGEDKPGEITEVTVAHEKDIWGDGIVKEPRVSWPSIGNVNPLAAKTFAQLLLKAHEVALCLAKIETWVKTPYPEDWDQERAMAWSERALIGFTSDGSQLIMIEGAR